MALIPIKRPTLSRAAPFLKRQLRPLDFLEGISFRENGLVAVYGRLLEKDDSSNTWQADTQGTHGFSGTGLFYRGKLAAMHTGAGNFYHFSEVKKLSYSANTTA